LPREPPVPVAINSKFNCGGCDYERKGPGDGVMVITRVREEEHEPTISPKQLNLLKKEALRNSEFSDVRLAIPLRLGIA
jgi:hypothetical protein